MPEDIKALLGKNTLNAAKRLIALINSDNERIALQASVAVLDRVLGKPVQAQEVEMSMSPDATITAQIHAALLRREEEKRLAAAKGEQGEKR